MDQLLRESVLSSRGFLSEAPPEGHAFMIKVTTEKVAWCPCKSLNQMHPWSCCLSPWSLKINPSSNLQYNLLKRFLAQPKISLKVSNKKLSKSRCTRVTAYHETYTKCSQIFQNSPDSSQLRESTESTGAVCWNGPIPGVPFVPWTNGWNPTHLALPEKKMDDGHDSSRSFF